MAGARGVDDAADRGAPGRGAAGRPPRPRAAVGLRVSSTAVGTAVVVRTVGELDLLTAPELLTVLDAHLADPAVTLVVLDLSRVEFLGAAGLGVLAEVATRAGRGPGPAAEHPPVRLVAPAEHRVVVRPWEQMHLQQIVPLHPTVPDALAAS